MLSAVLMSEVEWWVSEEPESALVSSGTRRGEVDSISKLDLSISAKSCETYHFSGRFGSIKWPIFEIIALLKAVANLAPWFDCGRFYI